MTPLRYIVIRMIAQLVTLAVLGLALAAGITSCVKLQEVNHVEPNR